MRFSMVGSAIVLFGFLAACGRERHESASANAAVNRDTGRVVPGHSIAYIAAGFALALPPESRIARGGYAGDTLLGPQTPITGRSQELGAGTQRPAFAIVVVASNRGVAISLRSLVDSIRLAANA